MPNKKAKLRKQQKARLNKQLKKQGRTAKQYKKWLEENHPMVSTFLTK